MDIIAVTISLLALSVLTIILNSLCLHIIRKSPTLNKNPSSRLIANLLYLHLFEGLIVFPSYAAKRLDPRVLFWARAFDNGFRFFYMVSFYGNCLGVLSISVDRFFSVYLLKRYRIYVNNKKIRWYLIILWTYIIGLCIIPFFEIKHDNEFFRYEIVTENGTNVTVDDQLYYYVPADEWTIFMLCFNCALPYILVVICYIYIISKLKKMETFKGEHRNKHENIELVNINGEEVKLKKKEILASKKIAYITLLVVATYGICYLPSIIYYLLIDICKSCFSDHYKSSVQPYVLYIVKYFAFLNAVATPSIYCFRHAEFTSSLQRIFSNMECKVTSEETNSDATVETKLIY